MADKDLPPTIEERPAPRKLGWVKRTADLPPDLDRKLETARGQKSRSEYLFEIVQSHFDKAA